MNSKFQLLEKTERMFAKFDDIVINFPKKQLVLKYNIEETLYLLIEYIHAYQINTSERIKEKYLKDLLVKISMLDFYVGVSFRRKIISVKQHKEICNMISEIRKICYGVIGSLKKNENGASKNEAEVSS